MSSKMLYRLSGGALLVGSPLFVLFLVFFSLLFGTPYDVSDPQKLMSSLWLFVNVVLLVATLLAAIGLPGVYARQAARMGWLGFFGFGLLFVAVLMMGVFNQLFAVFVLPWLATTVPNTTVSIAADKPPLLALFLISGVMLLVGAIFFGLATIRAGILPRGASLTLIISSVLVLIVTLPIPTPDLFQNVFDTIAGILFALAFTWLGYALWSEQRAESKQPDKVPQPATDLHV